MTNVFETIRETVTAKQCVEAYGFEINRAGFISCPFHSEKTASLKVYINNFYCFGCGAGGSVIDFVMKLFNHSEAIQAVKQLDRDFGLCLPLDEKPTKAEFKRQSENRQYRDDLQEYVSEFENWLDGAFRAIAEMNGIQRAGTFKPPNVTGKQAAEFLSLHSKYA